MAEEDTLARVTGRRVTIVLVGLALFAEFVALSGHAVFGWGDTHYALAPPPLQFQAPQAPSAAQTLDALAFAAAAAPAPAAGARLPFAYVEVRRWPWRPTGAHDLTPATTQSWRRRSDGAGREVDVAWNVPRTLDATRLTSTSAIRAGSPLPKLSADPALLRRRLGFGLVDGQPSAEPFVAFAALSAQEPIAPRVQAAILALLASIPGVQNDGTGVDRDGRTGDAVSLDSSFSGRQIRYTLVLAPGTGRLLEADQTFVGESSGDIAEGSTIAYTTYLADGWAANTMSRP